MTPVLTEGDIEAFPSGVHGRLYEHLGARPLIQEGVAGARFAVWDPNAGRVHVIGDFFCEPTTPDPTGDAMSRAYHRLSKLSQRRGGMRNPDFAERRPGTGPAWSAYPKPAPGRRSSIHARARRRIRYGRPLQRPLRPLPPGWDQAPRAREFAGRTLKEAASSPCALEPVWSKEIAFSVELIHQPDFRPPLSKLKNSVKGVLVPARAPLPSLVPVEAIAKTSAWKSRFAAPRTFKHL